MSKIIETTVYSFNELTEKSKYKAREWYRDGALDYDWWENTYDDAERVGLKITGFDLDRNRHATGEFIKCAESCANAILKEHGKDCETFKDATDYLKELAHLKEFHADKESTNGLTYEGDEQIEILESDFLKSILEDYSIILQKESEWIVSDEQADETILANEYTFTVDGKRF